MKLQQELQIEPATSDLADAVFRGPQVSMQISKIAVRWFGSGRFCLEHIRQSGLCALNPGTRQGLTHGVRPKE
ncbi:hypothetical protein GCM10009555_091090 [Acrocarpospora macrocephala]|uniref:Uncharacterized protein n=1 Tax=Acrocarpospora macrocephala TaxID=150177 RepID=A0A5M3WIT5_9ACTN|nr:hypothetical protein Amac_026810 [Acrocarpospora macrocephala]